MNRTIGSFFALLWAACALAQAPPTEPAKDASAAPPPIRDYMRYPDFAQPVLSPNGRHLAVLVPVKDRINLAVIELTTRKSSVLTSITAYDVVNPVWVGNDRLVFSVGQRNSPSGSGRRGGGLFMVSRDGKESRVLSQGTNTTGQSIPRTLRLLGTLPDSDREVLVSGRLRSGDSSDVYRLDITTGGLTLVTIDRPPRVGSWVLDRQRVPRVAVSSVKDELVSIVYYRASGTAPWTELVRLEGRGVGDDKFVPLGFAEDNQTLLVASNARSDTMAIYRYDPVARKLGDRVAGHPRYDMGSNMQGERVPGLVFSHRDRLVLGYEVEAERMQSVWTDESWARLQATIDAALPGKVNDLQRTDSDQTLVTSYDDRSSPQYFLFDESRKTLEPVARAMPWLTEHHLVEQRPFLLRTRDGLEIPSYYFLPRGHRPGDRWPTVFHVHGGPFARADSWGPLWEGGFGVAEAQLLASRGYAVVLPNFRITPGLGRKIYLAGFGAIGRRMSEDHEDAARWAVDQGFADPRRLCISGASYGGYASLQALVKTPDLFRCGIAGLSVTDLDMQLSSTAGDTAYSANGITFWRQVIGEDKVPGTARSVSPVHQAARIKAPVFMYAGSDDFRTPLEQTNAMVSALRAAGQAPELLIKKEEGHGYGLLENRIELYERILDFLDRHIGSQAPPARMTARPAP